MSSPWKIRWKRGITMEYMLTSSYVTILEWPLAAILDFREKKHVPLLGNFGTFYRSLKMTIWTTPEIFSFILFFSIFTPENA